MCLLILVLGLVGFWVFFFVWIGFKLEFFIEEVNGLE